MTQRPAVDYRYLGRPASPADAQGGLSGRGIAGAPHIEGHPEYVKSDCERVISDRNGCYITLGRDKPGSRISGYGHEHQSACIQMKVGRCSVDNLGATDSSGGKVYVDNNLDRDAASFYMSQKSNIDDYLTIRSGRVGMSRARSAIALKADAVRLVGREGIKLVTKGQQRNSGNGLMEGVKGIDLMAGNDDTDLQPLVKGRNLVEALDVIIQWAGKMNGIITTLNMNHQMLVTALMTHIHLPLPAGGFPDPKFQTICGIVQKGLTIDGTISLMGHRVNGMFAKMGYLKPYGRKYILSRHNNTN